LHTEGTRPALVAMWRRYTSYLHSHPLATKCITATTAALLGDAVCQRLEGSQPFSPWRSVRFTTWALITTPVVHFWYGRLAAARLSPLARTAADQFLYAPPATALFLFAMGVGAQGRGVEGGLSRASHLPRVLCENWCVWVPVQLVNFVFVPLPLQVAFGNVVGLFWAVRLSHLSMHPPPSALS
jgi:hypothetical protein